MKQNTLKNILPGVHKMSLRKEILKTLERGPIRRYYLYSEFSQFSQDTIRGRLSELINDGKIIRKANEKEYGSSDNDMFSLVEVLPQNV